MSELSGLELRRAACEALGWTKVRFLKGCSKLPPRYAGYAPHTLNFDSLSEEWLPAIESDPAISEPLFLEWCEKNRLTAVITIGGIATGIQLYDSQGEELKRPFVGSTPSEARARSIVAASKENRNA